MKRIAYFPFLGIILALMMTSCEDSATTEAPTLAAGQSYLNYDGPNFTAPQFAGGTYEAAALFPASELQSLVGDQLTQVVYYINSAPATCGVKIYTRSDNGAPDSVIYSGITSSQVIGGTWNTHTLSTPIDISGEDLWIAIRFSHVNAQRTLGCDPGPKVSNGDFVLEDGRTWTTFEELTGGESINWNIRGVIE